MAHKTLTWGCPLALAALFAACADDGLHDDLSDGEISPIAARRVTSVEVTTRSETPDGAFDEGTRYHLWAYADDGAGAPDFTSADAERFANVIGEERSTYVSLPRAEAKRVKGNLHIYGFTSARAEVVPGASFENFAVAPNADNTENYTDYLRGYMQYDFQDLEQADASYAVIPFSHIMSELCLRVVQYGKVTYAYDADGKYQMDVGPIYSDLKLCEVRLANASSTANYSVKSGNFGAYGNVDRRSLWSVEDPLDIPAEIPEEAGSGAPMFTRFVLPQKPETESQKMVLEVVVAGADAQKFVNSLNPDAYVDSLTGRVVVPLKLDDNSAEGLPLQFLSNHSYNLVVTFQEDNVRIVTIAPKIYPFFQGEVHDGQDYEVQVMEQPHVFDNLQWCDRYTGASLGAPSTIDEFQDATGFYYQKNRTIPFYPSHYEGGAYLTHDYWQIKEEDMNKGTVDWDYRRGHYWTGGEVYYRYGGKWVDVSAAEMFKYPVVRPIVSFYIPEQMQVTGFNQSGQKDWTVALQDSWYNGQGSQSITWRERENRYCSTVQDFIGEIKDGKAFINTYEMYLSDWQWHRVNKRLNYAMQITKEFSSKTWDANTENLPCPPGWRLPTKQDFLTVFPGSAAAGNITFLDFMAFGDDSSTVSPESDASANILMDENGKELLEIYVKTPFDLVEHPEQANSHFFPPLTVAASGGYRCLDPLASQRNKLSPEGDPEKSYESEYVISKRQFNASEWDDVSQLNIRNLDWKKYSSYSGKLREPDGAPFISRPRKHMNTTNLNFLTTDATWGVIYAIKKVGTNEAYRLRYRVKGIFQGDLEAYVLVVDQYKASSTDRLLYDVKDINKEQYFLNYPWNYPDATIYFPITGIVSDIPMIYWMQNKNDYVCSIYHYGFETILLSNEYDESGENQAVLRIKIGGSTVTNQFIFQGMARMSLAGQVRPVRTFRTGGD